MPGREFQIELDERFQQRQWRVDRFAWVVMGLVLLAALAGVFGRGGPLARDIVQGSGFDMEYDRFARLESPGDVRLRLRRPVPEVRVLLGSPFLQHITVEGMTPEPTESTLTDEGLLMTFSSAGQQGIGEIAVHYRPTSVGNIDLVVVVEGKTSSATSFVYP